MDHVLTLDLGNCGSGRTIRKVWIEELTDLTLFADINFFGTVYQ